MLSKIEAISENVNRKIVVFLGGTLFMTLTFMLVFESLKRTIMSSTTWGLYEVAEIIVSWLVYTAFAYALIAGFHVRVTLIIDRLPIRIRLWCEILTDIIGIALFSFLLYGAIPHAWDSFLIQETPMSPARTPLWLAKMALPVGAAIMLFQFLIRFARTVHPTREVIEKAIKEKSRVVGI